MIVGRALDYSSNVQFVLFTDRFVDSPDSIPIISAAGKLGIKVYSATEGLIGKIVPAKPPTPVIAAVRRQLYNPSELLEGKNPLLVLIDQCENPDNLGMILRSLDAAGIDGVVLTSDSVDPFNRLCVRASRGSVLSLRLAIIDNPENWLAKAQKNGFKVIASSAHGSDIIWSADFTGPVIMVVGNEHTGVRQSIRDITDSFIYIPMEGKMESLNIAVAGAIIAYEAARQRRSDE
jgi:TrmH family RNA methyltransferase